VQLATDVHPIGFADVETSHLSEELGHIWEIGIVHRGADGVDAEHVWQLRPDLTTADPDALRIGCFEERFVLPDGVQGGFTGGPGAVQAMTRRQVGEAVARLLNEAVMVGSNPHFDAVHLTKFLRSVGIEPTWTYRPLDIVTLAAGCLHGMAAHIESFYREPVVRAAIAGQTGWPWRSYQTSEAIGVPRPAPGVGHTAIGDARWARDVWDTVVSSHREGTGGEPFEQVTALYRLINAHPGGNAVKTGAAGTAPDTDTGRRTGGCPDGTSSSRLPTDAAGTARAGQEKRPAPSLDEAFFALTRATADGHLIWTGSIDKNGLPRFAHGGSELSARRVSVRLLTGTDPQERLYRRCTQPKCVDPRHLGPRGALSLAEAWAARTRATADGHLIWTGASNTRGMLILEFEGRTQSARRLAFRLRTGKQPVGKVRSTCDQPACVAPRHVEDAEGRARLDALVAALRPQPT
jgi:hypothetical protein